MKNLLILLAAFGVSASAFATPTIVNGSFESQQFSTNQYYYSNTNPNAITGWTVGNAPGHGTSNDAILLVGNSYTPQNGKQMLWIGGNDSYPIISQMLTGLDIGATYEINFYLSSEDPRPNLQSSVRVGVGSSATKTFTDTATTGTYYAVWSAEAYDFLATANSELLTFDSSINHSIHSLAYDAALDNVSIRQLSAAPVPEPTSIALLGIGLLGAGISRRKKAK